MNIWLHIGDPRSRFSSYNLIFGGEKRQEVKYRFILVTNNDQYDILREKYAILFALSERCPAMESSGDMPEVGGEVDMLVGNVQFPADVFTVILDGLARDIQEAGDFLVG